MKPDAAISKLLRECDTNNVNFPENPWQALREVIRALRNAQHDNVGQVQIPTALEQLKRKFGDGAKALTVAPSPRVVQRQKRMLIQDLPKSKRRNVTVASNSNEANSNGQPGRINTVSPVASKKKKKKYARKSRIQEEVEATSATRDENQALVDQLVQLGEFEMHHGHSQRGISRMRAAKAIRDSGMVVTSGAQAKQLDHVGPAVSTKIDQLLNEGLTAALSEYDGDDEALSVTK